MFAKIFTQIFDSSIADDHVVRHVFMDLLVLADPTGVVDMTPDAISRRTNVPKDIVEHALEVLASQDLRSRSHLEDGARIVLIDSHRSWGWQIVNYDHYRQLQDEESRRAYFRNKKRESRQKSRATVTASQPNPSKESKTVQNVKNGQRMSTQEEGEGEVEGEEEGKKSALLPETFAGMELQIAHDLFLEFRVPSDATMIRLAGQALVFECSRLGSPEAAVESMRTAMTNAATYGEVINRFWFSDQKYDSTKSKNGTKPVRQPGYVPQTEPTENEAHEQWLSMSPKFRELNPWKGMVPK